MSHLRVIAGEAKGRRLKLVPGDSTRPVTDRVKEALFNILGPMIQGTSFLDLFAGTGSVGIEALSRGAASAVLIDNQGGAITTIQENLEITGLKERATVIRADVFQFLRHPSPSGFDFVYVAPPQYKEIWHRVILQLDRDPALLHPDAWIIAQIDPVEYQDLALHNLVEFDRRQYGSTELLFFEYAALAAEPQSGSELTR
ncbi:MAG: 16S rRNA (guanine(966)-N(2))-methyltransferase RsmD [Anaerolineales bacterium]